MHRSPVIRGLIVLAGALGLIVGCSETPTEGDLPATRIATPEEMEKLQEKLLQEKVAPNAKYTPPPGVNMPPR